MSATWYQPSAFSQEEKPFLNLMPQVMIILIQANNLSFSIS